MTDKQALLLLTQEVAYWLLICTLTYLTSAHSNGRGLVKVKVMHIRQNIFQMVTEQRLLLPLNRSPTLAFYYV